METTLKVKLISHTMNPELVIATAGKLCYSPSNIDDLMEKQTEESIEKFVNMITSIGHGSVLEHTSFTFGIEGVSRSLTHQLVRHRIASYSQQSQRYVKEVQFEYVIPQDIKNNPILVESYKNHMEDTQRLYDEIVDKLMYDYIYEEDKYGKIIDIQLKKCNIDKNKFESWKKENKDNEKFVELLRESYKKLYSALEKKAIENARYIFPNACETKIICTMNLRSLINFCHHRCCRRAQEEIFNLAWTMLKEVEKVSPLLAKSLGASCQFGPCPEGAMCCMMPFEKKR
ncbi:FAD-dependent thymidylate synthase [Terrisporobacter sp.]|uniref:FAD-dependent thymidylate synthase n=1 Tax=Terrisporobacter sp. TaxID=1965305 RepID=UPI00262BDDB2|nr:FAD-dependent thymidylate synthase [Terrisporobacter sp.]